MSSNAKTRTSHLIVENYTSIENQFLLYKIDNAKERVIILLKAFILYEPIYPDIIKCCRIIEIIASKIRVFIMTNISEWYNSWHGPEYNGIDDGLDYEIQKFATTIKLPNTSYNYRFNKKDRSQELYILYEQEYKHLVKEIIRLKFEKYKKDIEEIEGYNFYGNERLYDTIIIKRVKYWLSNENQPVYKNIKEINEELIIKYQPFIEKSIREHKELIKKKEEYRRLQQQEYEETKKKIKDQLHSLVEMPSRLFGRLMSSSSKKLDINEKINIWSDKIIEMISDLSVWKPQKCENLDECIEKITTIIDIINSFVERPNTMIKQEFSISSHTNNNYNIQKNKIYENFLYDYKITFTDKELEHPEYLKLFEDYKKIIIVLQNMKLDDCKNTFSEEKTGGKKLKTLKSKTDLKNKKRKVMNINQSQKKQ